uniref:Astacin domain-containing protein n=1 Tax=Meloidogyne hapla TaxID=6305 RepID=A0A1I8B266_MELHA
MMHLFKIILLLQLAFTDGMVPNNDRELVPPPQSDFDTLINIVSPRSDAELPYGITADQMVDEEEEAKKLTGEKSSISYSKRTTLNRLYEEDVEYRSFRNTLDDLKKTERSKKLMKILSGLDKDQMGKEIRQQFCGENKTAIQNAMKQTRDTVKSSKLYKKGGKYLSLDQISKFYNVLEYCFNVEQKYEVKLHRVLNKFCNKNVYPWASGILTKANITYKNCNLVLKSTDLKKESFFKNLCLCFKEKEEDEEKEDWFEEENVEEGETHVGSPILHGKCLKESTLKMGGNGLSDIAVQSHNYPMG